MHNSLRYQCSLNQLKFEVKCAKRSHALKFMTTISHSKVWQLNSWYRGIQKSFVPALQRPDGSWASTSEDKTNLLLETWFPPCPPLTGTFHSDLESAHKSTRTFHSVTFEEVERAIRDTSNTSAPGINSISYKALKWAFAAALDELTTIVHASVKFGVHHPSWKTALIIPIPKPNKKSYTTPRAHRPIQLLDCLSKIVKKVIAKHLLFDVGKFNLMPFFQFGGRPSASCLDTCMSLVHNIQVGKNRSESQLVSSFLTLDIKGFFDHVDHDRMIHVLWEKGFPLNICHWVKSFLSDQLVSIRLDDF